MKAASTTLLIFLMTALPSVSYGQVPTEYTTDQGDVVFLPLGDISFADRVVAFSPGDPQPDSLFLHPEQMLGPPDYKYVTDTTYVTVGCEGSIVLQFVDNLLFDGPGPDLYVFEIGPDVEGTFVELSTTGEDWISLGEIRGGKSWIDIADVDTTGTRFPFVRLTDMRSACSSNWPGADLDAIAAANTAVKLSLDSNILFEFDMFDLRPEAGAIIDSVASLITDMGNVNILVEGHTDSVGTATYNLDLSRKRSKSVQEALELRLQSEEIEFAAVGYGESFPVAPNSTAEGRQENRRVDIIVSTLSLK